jgi:hypothetical protein
MAGSGGSHREQIIVWSWGRPEADRLFRTSSLFLGCAIQSRVPESILEMDGVNKSGTPVVLGWETSIAQQRAHHDAQSAVQSYDFAILVRTVVACWFHAIAGFRNNGARCSGMPEFATLVHAESTVVAIVETKLLEERLDNNITRGGYLLAVRKTQV